MLKTHLEIQILDYWQACQWLTSKYSSEQQCQLALRSLKRQAGSPMLGYLSVLALQYVEDYEKLQSQFSLWKGMVS